MIKTVIEEAKNQSSIEALAKRLAECVRGVEHKIKDIFCMPFIRVRAFFRIAATVAKIDGEGLSVEKANFECGGGNSTKQYYDALAKFGINNMEDRELLVRSIPILEVIGNHSSNDPVTAKQIENDLGNNKENVRAREVICFLRSKGFPITSRPGRKGGYFLTSSHTERQACSDWVSSWRRAMKIVPTNYPLPTV